MSEPIIINDSTLEGQIATLSRYLLTALGAFALGKGWIDDNAMQLLTGLLTIAVPAAWGIYKTFTNKQRTITLAEAADDSVAQVVTK